MASTCVRNAVTWNDKFLSNLPRMLAPTYSQKAEKELPRLCSINKTNIEIYWVNFWHLPSRKGGGEPRRGSESGMQARKILIEFFSVKFLYTHKSFALTFDDLFANDAVSFGRFFFSHCQLPLSLPFPESLNNKWIFAPLEMMSNNNIHLIKWKETE